MVILLFLMEIAIENEDLLDHATKHLPFKIKERELTKEEISARIKDSSEKVKKCFWNIIKKNVEIFSKFLGLTNETNWIINILISISISSILSHMILRGVIVKEYFDTDNKLLMIGLLCITCLFLVGNFCFSCPCSCLIGKLKLRVYLYALVLGLYVVVFYYEAEFLMTNNFNYFLASLILFLLSVNAPGFLLYSSGFVPIAYYIAYCFFAPILYLKLKCCYNPREDENARNTYYYDPTKTSERTCTICYKDFEESDEICICRAHLIHIFHEKCISNELSKAPTCPLCANNQPAKFY